MKTTKILKLISFVLATFWLNTISAQNFKPKVTVLNVDVQGMNVSPEQMGNIVRLELDKIQQFEVMDKYDVKYIIQKHNLNIDNCYGKLCLVETGKIIGAEKMFTGNIEVYNETVVLSLRMIDVVTETIEKTEVMEFLNLPKELQNMIGLTLRKMFNLDQNQILLSELTKKNNFENAINTPNIDRLRLDGPRMGFTVFSGNTADILNQKTNVGGFDASPVMFQFGYQFERQYLNSGNVQTLFEFIPMVTGLDQGLFIPSLALLHGIRLNRGGWEFAFGPTLSFIQTNQGTYIDGVWTTKQQYFDKFGVEANDLVTRMDSRGDVSTTSAFLIAFGKSFKSGKINVPVNAYVIPGRNGVRFGLSFGFNGKNTAR